ncbi:N-6 DNA methylase [Mycobacterium sherrisii]|uniref:site-specific DNA-methyltransferase (adenine-specific) n=1 Tax=Mycobacterium sherrisii TaxID=243061 RepID=A0A1E3STZ5_9MYCO|nr:type I restriction-modification system subunit M [Mycobacterium sherrisii]MEC4761744.1 N-6 DNA methylase [Mycobacterium sherrisii]ODR05559.1 restriction endonuclease subunit M [Mycobacterium sherrisii]
MAPPKELKSTLWKAAEKLRGSLSASQYKDAVLGLVFLKHIRESTWNMLAANADNDSIGRMLDAAIIDATVADHALGVPPGLYANLDQRRLGELVRLLDGVPTGQHPRDALGEVYEYFLSRFARAEGKRGGEFFTPPSVVRLMVEVLEPTGGRVYDPCCGSGGMFVQTGTFITRHAGDRTGVRIYGQESIEQTWRMAKLNLAIHGIDNTGLARGDTLAEDVHAGLQMDYVMANPPFNIKDWARAENDGRWRFGVPPAGNANYGWIQHILAKLAPGGKAGVVMANRSISSNTLGEGAIRSRIVDADLVSCMVALPTQLFRSTSIPVCLWFFAKDKGRRAGQVLFVDARGFGHLVDRTERVLTDAEVTRIADTYHAWSGAASAKGIDYQNVPGFCRSVATDEIAAANYLLTPGRYVGTAVAESDAQPAAAKITRLTKDLLHALDESARLETAVREQVRRLC